MIVDQVLCAAGPVDAVTGQARACRALFRAWGWEGQDYAPVIAPGIPHGEIRRLGELEPRPGRTLLLHYSGWAEGLERVFDGRARSLLISHNITPARFFWEHEPLQAVQNELARDQLARLIARVDRVAGVSELNAAELRALGAGSVEVIPVLVDRGALGPPAGQPAGPVTVLFVGRLVPHKRQDLIIRSFARYHRRDPQARLELVGVPMTPGYRASLTGLARSLAPGAVAFHQDLSPPALADVYRRAHVFLCLSEHEGFCIPLLEAMHFGVPVIARDAGAVAEVLAGAGVLLGAEDGVEVVCELIDLVAHDPELRAEMIARGRARLAAYDHRVVARRLREVLEEVAR